MSLFWRVCEGKGQEQVNKRRITESRSKNRKYEKTVPPMRRKKNGLLAQSKKAVFGVSEQQNLFLHIYQLNIEAKHRVGRDSRWWAALDVSHGRGN